MSCDDSISFPLIDFSDSDLRPGTATWDLVKSQVQKAAEEYGCFQALFNKIPGELQKAMNEALEELFQFPPEIKERNVSEKPFHGYLGSSSSTSVYESLGIDEPDIYNKVQNFTNIFWPQGNTELSTTLYSFSEQLVELDKKIRKIIVECLGVEKYLDEHMNSAYYFLRVAKYKATQTSEKKTGLRVHTDKNFITIYYQNQVDGLEMQTKDGNWIPVKFSPNSVFIMIAESLRALSNGRLYSPYHRVMLAADKPRYSALLFSVPKEGYIVRALEELVDEEHPLLCKPFDYTEYLKRRYEDHNAKITSVPPLNKYFGA